MRESIETVVGFDVGDSSIAVCCLRGQARERTTLRTERGAVELWLASRSRVRLILETGTHTPWIARAAQAAGHEVIVADARRVKLITKSRRKTDRRDAELLARLGRSELELLHPVHVRSERSQKVRAVLRLREGVVTSRSKLINIVRGVLKTDGVRLPACDADAFARRVQKAMPAGWGVALEPMLRAIQDLTQTIREYDRLVAGVLRQKEYAETAQRLDQVVGVGPQTTLAVITAVEDPHRFQDGRQMAAYLGLVPRARQSGEADPRLGITKEGDTYARQMLVSAAQYVLQRGPDTDLKRWGLALEAKWGPKTRKRAAVAVARKLAVLLWRLWVSGERYVPLKEAA